MTDADLRLYLVYKRKADDLRIRIDNLRKTQIMTCDKVKASMPEFPYIEVMTAVYGQADNYAKEEYEEEKKLLIRTWNQERAKALKKMHEIENFINKLPEKDDIQNIFRWVYMDGMKQTEVGKKLFVDRSTISKRMSKYING